VQVRILQIIHSDDPGGVLAVATSIADGLTARGLQVETAFLFPHARAGTPAKLAGALRMGAKVLRGHYDALVSYQAAASILIGTLGVLSGCPRRLVHQTCLPAETKAAWRWLDRQVGRLGLYTANIANTAATARAFESYPARYARAMLLIEHGVDRPIPARGRAETLHSLGIPPEGPILLSVGRLVDQKNQEVLIDALVEARTARLVIAGDGPKAEAYRARAREQGVGERLHLVGPRSPQEVADLYGAADLFVFPSRWETFGLAAVEAAMAGLPVIASDLPVLREVLGRQGAVFLPPEDGAAWRHAIATALGVPRDAAHLAAQAEALAERYSPARMVERYVRLLEGAPA